MSQPAVFHLIGYPAAGKLTVAEKLAGLRSSGPDRIVVVDNHYFNNLIFGVVERDDSSPIDPRVWPRVLDVREAVLRTIEEVSPRAWSFVFTNVLFEGDPMDVAIIERLQRLARARDARFVPVRLVCDVDELARRATAPGRRERMKWTDPDGVRLVARTRPLLDVAARGGRDIDVTTMSPEAVARAVVALAE